MRKNSIENQLLATFGARKLNPART